MTWRNVLDKDKSPKKRVCMLVHANYPYDVRVRRAAETLFSIGFEVHVICSADEKQLAKQSAENCLIHNGVYIHPLPLKKKRGSKIRYLYEFAAVLILGMIKITKLQIKNKFDIIHIHNMPDFLVFAALIPKLCGAKVILDVHDPMSELFQVNYKVDENNALIKAIKFQEKISYNFANYLITVSHPMARNVANKKGSNNNVEVVQNLPDQKIFPVKKNLDKWPRHNGSFTLLYSGTITEHYRLDIAIRAIEIAKESIPQIKIIILGEGNRLNQLSELANELNISDRVIFKGRVDIDEVRNIMEKVDVGISTHQNSKFGDLYFSNKMVEFLTQGLPVVTSRTKTVKEYLPEDVVYYFNPANYEDCAAKLIDIYKNPEKVRKKMANANVLLKHLNWQNEEKKLIKFYNTII